MYCLEKCTYILRMVVAYTITCTYTLHTFVPFPLFSPIIVALPTLLFSHYVLYVCYFVHVCVFVVLTAVPDEYILNISRVSENEATDLLTIIMLCMLFNTVLFQ